MRYIYYCSRCRKTYSQEADYIQNEKCPECGTIMIPTHVTDEDWHSKTDEEKEKSKEDFDGLAKALEPTFLEPNTISNSMGIHVAMETFKSNSKDVFSIIGGMVIAIGIIAGIIVAAAFGKSSSGTFYERNWLLTIGLFLMTSIPFCFFGLVMGAIAEALTALEKICNNIAKLRNQ